MKVDTEVKECNTLWLLLMRICVQQWHLIPEPDKFFPFDTRSLVVTVNISLLLDSILQLEILALVGRLPLQNSSSNFFERVPTPGGLI